jgi:hypothetical protein
MVAGLRRPSRVLEERHEVSSVECGVAEVESIPTCPALDDDSVPGERPAEPRDVCLQAVTGGRRRGLPPDLVDQTAVGNDLPCTQEQRGEHGLLLPPAQIEGTFTSLSFERTEDPEAEWRYLARLEA